MSMGQPMMESRPDATSLLTQDHRRVEELFSRFESYSGQGSDQERDRLAEEITRELTIHAEIEEEVFYPAVRRVLAEGDELVDESLHEHAEVKDVLAQLEGTDSSSPGFDSAMAKLISEVRHHVNEEEGEMFPKLRQSIGQDRLTDLGADLVRARDERTPGWTPLEMPGMGMPGLEPYPTPLTPTAEPARRRPARRKATTRKGTARRSAARKSTGRKSTTRKSTGRKSTTRRKSTGRKSTTRRKSTGRKSTTRKSPAKRKSTGRKSATRRKSPARKSPARRKSTARKSTSRKSASRSRSKRR